MTSATSALKPKVLRLGRIDYGLSKWAEIAKYATVLDCESKTREEFFNDLKGKYKDITNISRTYQSVHQTGRFDAELATHLPTTVKSISHTGAGYDQIDPDPFTKLGIQISNITVPVEGPTADTAVYLLLGTLRNFQEGHNLTIQGEWKKGKKAAGAKLGATPHSKVVGILGMGGIGRQIRDRLVPFQFKDIIYYNRKRLTPELEQSSKYVSFEELIKQSDILVISVPLNPKTRHLISKEVLADLKPGSIIINTARGAVIDEAALLESLKSGHLGGFGSDVFEFEPQVPQELLDLPNVVSLPHMGTHAWDAIEYMEEWVAENVESYIFTGKVKSIIPDQYDMVIDPKPLLKRE
ncbi:D-isomer specific 2-hydroxyacid dehydrogenase [Scheffersomyces coipomensis]|uniref:D-isomer specific 2-hydroxyacid dehydrogenase n=1 Tax=Scheffersomyces coipomensis TaxID=1788519 RepID=UPI00315D4B10